MTAKATASASETVDVIVLGGGGAGLAAAVSAASRCMRTVLLEKCPQLGGTTRWSVGSVSAAGTRLQKRAGIQDNIDDFRVDMMGFIPEFAARDNPRLRYVLAAEAATTVDWLEDLGVVFSGPYPEPPNRVPRMHNAVPGSRMYVLKLTEAAQRAGVDIRLQAEVHELLTDAGGRISGVAYSIDGVRRELHASRGVILATGDFAGSRPLREAHLHQAAATAIPVNPDNTGDGLALARRVGAALHNMDVVIGPQFRFPGSSKKGFIDSLPSWSWLARLGAFYFERAPRWMLKPLVTSLMIAHMSPTEKLYKEGAVLVDLDGEALDTEKGANALSAAREASGYIVLDAKLACQFSAYPYYISTAPGIAYAYFSDYRKGRPDLVHAAPGVNELAAKLGMDASRLGVSLKGLQPGELFALGPVRAMLTITEGGLAVDEQCRVLREDDQAIDGLYAVGGIGQGGMALKGHGLHLVWAMTSGRLAGEMVSRRMPPVDPFVPGDPSNMRTLGHH
jgi:fumarate reductase flavoprotein subunit